MKLTFTGVTLHKAERDLKRGLLHFSASLTKPVIEGLKWGELPKAATNSGMDGAISQASMSMSAKQSDLFEKGEFRADVQSVSKFEIVRMELKGKKGKGFRHVVRFVATFVAADILALADQWIMAVGDGTATLTVSGELVESKAEDE
jgi:hypothetical protein